LPQGWATCQLRECAEVLDNLRVPVNSDERAKRQGNVPYYGATCQVGWIDDYLFDEELLLIGEDGAPFFDKSKPIAYLIRGKSWVNNHAHVLRAKTEVTSNLYLKWFLDNFDFNGYVNGTTRLKLTQGSMNEIPVLLPPLNEQRRIVAKLEELLASVDSSQQRLAKIPVILKRFRQAVLAAACSGRLTADWREENGFGEGEDLPEGWRLTTVGEYCVESFYGPRFAKEEYTSDGIPTIRTTDFTNNGYISLNNPPRITLPEEKKKKLLLRENDLLVTRTGSIGKMAIFKGSYEALPSAYLIRFRFSGEIYVDFVFHSLMSPRGQELMGLGTTAVTQPNINAETIKGLPLALPPLPEQQEIVRRVESFFTLADQLEARYRKAKTHVDKLTQSILAKAFRGELVSQDPNDEPAAALLKLIRADRAKAVSTPRNKATTRPARKTYKPEPEPLPLAAEPVVAYSPSIPERILAAMQPGRDYSRAEITAASGISDVEWTWAIRQLKNEDKVRQAGKRRGSRYSLN
jgi:type I restriction enzyme, S subunit